MALAGGYHRLTRDQEGFEQRNYMYKDCKKLQDGGVCFSDPFMKSTLNKTAKDLLHLLGSYLEQLEVCLEKPDTFHIEKTFLLNR